MQREIWVEVLEGFYEVSNLGRIRRVKLWSGKKVERYPAVFPDDYGYPRINISINGRHGNARIHVLVAEAFIGPRPEGMEVNHRDLDRSNCRWDNLEYKTHADNNKYSAAAGMYDHRDEANPNSRVTAKDVINIRLGSMIRPVGMRIGKFITKCCQEYELCESSIRNILDRRTWNNI